MARKYAQVKVSIWIDDDFLLLSDSAQALYFRLLTAPKLSFCGVCDWRPKRLALLASGLTEKKVITAAEELAEAGYVVFDDEAEEILIRSFIRHDGVLQSPNLATALASDYADTHSVKLRRVILHELVRLHTDQPDLKGWTNVSELLEQGLKVATDTLPETLPDTLPERGHEPLTPPTPLSLLPSPTSVTVEEDFDIWYSIYPKKVGRPVALKSYKTARKKASKEALADGARVMAKAYANDKTYCPNPSTWLNQERWNDEDGSVTTPAPTEWYQR